MIDLKLSDLLAPPSDEDIVEALAAEPVAPPKDLPPITKVTPDAASHAPAGAQSEERGGAAPGASKRGN